MESFYGGAKGDSINIKVCYEDVLSSNDKNQTTVVKPAVQVMMDDFKHGALTTSKVGYGEYVIINTSYGRNENNGNIYRRGFDITANPVYRLRKNVIREAAFTFTVAELIASDVGLKVEDTFEFTKGKYYFKNIEAAAALNFSENLISSIAFLEINSHFADRNVNLFYLFEGYGAEYIGRILGPVGNTPTVEVNHYDTVESISNDEFNPLNKGNMSYTVTGNDLVPGLVEMRDNLDGTYTPVTNDEIKVNWVNVEDINGNVQNWMVGFKVPYFVPKFYTEMIEPYMANGSRLYDGYEKLVTERAFNDGKNGKYPFFKAWTLSVPHGVKGDSLDSLALKKDDTKLYARYRSYDKYRGGELIPNENGDELHEVGDLNLIEKIVVTEHEIPLANGVIPRGHVLVKYTVLKNTEQDIVYDGETGWFDIGLAKGKDGAPFKVYCVAGGSSVSDLDDYVTNLNSLSFEPENIFQYDPETNTLDESRTNDLNVDYNGSCILYVIDETVYYITYDYSKGEWFSQKLDISEFTVPERVITADAAAAEGLMTNGYFVKSHEVKSVYDLIGKPAEWYE